MALSEEKRREMAARLAAPQQGVATPAGTEATNAELLEAYEKRRAEQREEYGQYVATQDIYVGNALAFVNGQAVPKGHVERFGYLDAGVVRQVGEGDSPGAMPVAIDEPKSNGEK
jgi:hypothetical protein